MREEYQNLIKALSVDAFRNVIKEYLKNYYTTNDVFICDGTNDGGNDVEIKIRGEYLKTNIQITVQKLNINLKLDEDVKKAKYNHENLGYRSELLFFCSQIISKRKRDELERDASLNHNITLKIFDANQLAELVNTYPIIGQIINQYSYIPVSDSVKLNQKEKNLFELFVKGEKASDIKKNFTKSIILSYLYEHSNVTLNQIKGDLNTDFSNSISENFLISLLEELVASELIMCVKIKPRIYNITELGVSKFKEAELNSDRQKNAFIFEIEKYLSEQNLVSFIQSVIDDILELYSSSYQMTNEDIQEREPQRKRLSKIYKSLKQRIEANIGESQKTEKIILDLLSICQKNDFLNNINMSMLFMELYRSNMLDEYMKQSPLIIYLDTQLLLQIICLACEKESNEEDLLYKSVQSLIEAIQNSNFKIELRTSIDYVEEAFYHIAEGVKLDRFLSLSFIKEIGASKNVIFNYYLF